LDRLADATARIAGEVHRRHEGAALDAEWDWRAQIDAAIDADLPTDATLRQIEEQARDEKASALRTLARSRVSVLIGPAGTGKTTMLEALCSDPAIKAGGVLLLAPTGKARVQLSARVDAPAQTVAQFLRPDRWDELGYRMAPDAAVEHGFRTVVIDEASMLTEEMLAATLDALAGVDRLVLCGDPRQLPPIGAGRPFADMVAFLREAEGAGGAVAELSVGRRQLPTAGEPEHVRDDVAIASLFSIDAVLYSADEALARAVAGESDPTFKLVTWLDEADLHRKLISVLCEEDLGLSARDAEALVRSLGATQENGARPRFPFGSAGAGAEAWQVLSPVRARPGGIAGLNRMVRMTWRPGDATLAQRSRSFAPPMGADQVIFNDKVMCLRNDNRREAYQPNERTNCQGSVANGEIGVVVWGAGRKGQRPNGLKIEFSTQVGRQYTFWDNELNAENERGEFLELAYAITIHKSQGSQFGTTFVVVPDPCPLLSPELLYTALTRQRDRVVLLKQGDASTLRAFASPSRSETARRLTCLFRPADPFTLSDGTVIDGSHVHRTRNGELVRSKSEVIVADTLYALGIEYGYEVELAMPDKTRRLPDFTIRASNHKPVYWEHLGMLDRPGYAADWKAKQQWYAAHGILPWTDGGGPDGTLVSATENLSSAGIDAQAIEALAREVFASPLTS
jgi:ATP-dependent exoDNAse (exonuclease V) alpha subunit